MRSSRSGEYGSDPVTIRTGRKEGKMGRTTPAGEFGLGRVLILALLIVAAICLATLALTASARAIVRTPRAPTTLTIKANGLDLSGKVKSPRLRCLGGRTISLFKQVGRKQNPRVDTRIATDTSERQGDIGVWSTGNTGIAGKLYVRTGRTPACRADISPTIRVRR
jgi:hypothetical protein